MMLPSSEKQRNVINNINREIKFHQDFSAVEATMFGTKNFEPHPFNPTDPDLCYAASCFSADGMTADFIRQYEGEHEGSACNDKGCDKLFDEHTYLTYITIMLKRDVSLSEITRIFEYLPHFVANSADGVNIDLNGFAIVETK